MMLTTLSDDELLASLVSICFETRKLLARLLLLLIEVEQRRLDARLACSSLYDFCRRKLGMSENEAVRRIEAARVVKRFPALLRHIEDGDVNLTTLLLLRPHFTEDNVSLLALGARGKTKLEVQELIAARAPKPDVMTTLTPLPAPSPAKEDTPRMEPLSPERYRLDMTLSDAVRAKLERARDLLSHHIAPGDLEAVLDRALDALLAKLEKERPGDDIPMAVRREVFARDGERCTFVGKNGERCPATSHLQIDHVVPRARGGTNEPRNLHVVCARHNHLYAEQDFGREHVERCIQKRRRRSPKVEVLDEVRTALLKLGFRLREIDPVLARLLVPEAPTHPSERGAPGGFDPARTWCSDREG